MEVITGIERRRRWRAEDKSRIVAETEEPGSSVAIVARRHDISRGLLWHWRRAMRESRPGAAQCDDAAFLPVNVIGGATSRQADLAHIAGRVEIALPDGTCVRVGSGSDLALLRRVLAVLRS